MKHYLYFLLFFLGSNTFAQSKIENTINQFCAADNFKFATIGISVVDVANGKELAGKNASQSLIPASTLKVVTTATALSELGADFRFKTQLEYDGEITTTGLLKGNIYITGGGDPVLGSPVFKETENVNELLDIFVGAIQDAGIKEIDGRIIGDDTAFSGEIAGRAWIWEDIGNYYGAGAMGLNIHENFYYLDLKQVGSIGAQPPVLNIRPWVPGLRHTNELKSAGKGTGDNAYIFGAPYHFNRFVRGTIPIGNGKFTIKGAVPDPPFLAASLLLKKLEGRGVETGNIATSILECRQNNYALGNRKTIYLHKSPKLSAIVKRANLKSVNLYCEAILKTLGLEKYGEGSVDAGLRFITEFWEGRGLDLDGFFMVDGSGLSPRNAISARHLASLLGKVGRDKVLYNLFATTLPESGRSGALRNRFKGTNAIGKIRAKSGGMERVQGYVGYVVAASGKTYSFAILVNNFTGRSSVVRNQMEKLMLAFYEKL